MSDVTNLPLLEDEIEHVEPKPTWRGWIHAATFPVAIALGVILVVVADGPAAKVSSAVFFASSLLLFGTSAVYHRFNWSPAVKGVLKRLDHANIFVLIAGTYTPISILCLPPQKAALLLWLVWGGAALGIGFRVLWVGAPRWLYVPLYVLLGWAAVMFIVDLFAGELGHDDPGDHRRSSVHARCGRLRPQAAEPVPRQVRVPRDLPHRHAARVPLPLDRDPAGRRQSSG